MDNQFDINKYCLLMQEIKERMIYMHPIMQRRYCSDIYFSKIDLEICCLQIRKMLELMALGSLVMHKIYFNKAASIFAKAWNAKYIIRDIKRMNPCYFPRAISPEVDGPDNAIQDIFENVLHEDLFIKIYDKCGKVLHTPNPLGSKTDYQYYYDNLVKWADLIFNTLRNHLITFIEYESAFIIQFNEPTESITYIELKRE